MQTLPPCVAPRCLWLPNYPYYKDKGRPRTLSWVHDAGTGCLSQRHSPPPQFVLCPDGHLRGCFNLHYPIYPHLIWICIHFQGSPTLKHKEYEIETPKTLSHTLSLTRVRVTKLCPSCVVGPPWHCCWWQCTTLKTSFEAEAEMKRERASQPETAGATSQMRQGTQNGDAAARGTVGGGEARKRNFYFCLVDWLDPVGALVAQRPCVSYLITLTWEQ